MPRHSPPSIPKDIQPPAPQPSETEPSGVLSPGRMNKAIASLLDEPEVRLLMKADGIAEHSLETILNAAANTADSSAATFKTRRRPDRSYRPGVGILLLNPRGHIFVGRRRDVGGDAWQMPQGGIDKGETPREAILRELNEEIGTNKVTLLAESRQWFTYEVPRALAAKAWNGRWRGQRQRWFAGVFKGKNSDINLNTHQCEFDAWRWVTIRELSALPVSFKGPLYLDVIREFSAIFGSYYRETARTPTFRRVRNH